MAEFEAGMERYKTGTLMQDALGLLPNEEREFLISGVTPAMWKELFPPQPPLSQERVEEILMEYVPIMEEFFGGTTRQKPLQIGDLTHAIVYDHPDTPPDLKKQVEDWVQGWASRQGYVLAE